jgi:peptidoglycan/xylan/chitin deacetylase (PgdA/CDA1 family)
LSRKYIHESFDHQFSHLQIDEQKCSILFLFVGRSLCQLRGTTSLRVLGIVFLLLLTACSSSFERTPTQLAPQSQPRSTDTLPPTAYLTEIPSTSQPDPTAVKSSPTTLQPTKTATQTNIPTFTSTAIPLETFTSPLLRSGVIPQAYVIDTCSYLERRWAGDGSPPGTIVVPIMFHSIYKDGRIVNDPKEISVTEFESFHTFARSLGFETITTEQLYAFLDHNALIPARSMIMIVDDRRPGVIQERFMPVLDQYDWSVTSAYITDPDSLMWAWELMDQLFATGRVDIQSHGYSGQLYIVEGTTEEEIHQEIDRSTDVLEERYGKRPIALIWPGGNFTQAAVRIARQDGYQLGFTAYSRGPLMFNWIPLGEEERLIGDPLMVLPRAWSNSAIYNLEQALEIADKAQAYAEENFKIEARWYNASCGGSLIPPFDESDAPDP